MSVKYLNGVSYPIIEITDQYNRRVENGLFTLPLTNELGLEERSVERFTEYENLSFVKKKKTKGWDMYFTLNFPEYAAKATATKIMMLLDWEYAISNTPAMYNYRIYLTPRADVMSRKFEVIGDVSITGATRTNTLSATTTSASTIYSTSVNSTSSGGQSPFIFNNGGGGIMGYFESGGIQYFTLNNSNLLSTTTVILKNFKSFNEDFRMLNLLEASIISKESGTSFLSKSNNTPSSSSTVS